MTNPKPREAGAENQIAALSEAPETGCANEAASILLRVENLSKRFGSVQANDQVSFEVRKGEIHCLLGENGAGKSTMAECLYGTYKPDSGTIYFKGQEIRLTAPRAAINLGIGMVHQHFVLVPPMSVVENIIIGTQKKGLLLRTEEAETKIQGLCDEYGIDLDIHAAIKELSVSQQQWTEILKALYVGVDLLILDEPTAVLTPQEITALFRTVKKMAEHGLSVVLITHKFAEVLEVSDRITVLRKGKLIGTVNTRSINDRELARMMVGRDVIFHVEKEVIEPGDLVLEMEQVTLRNSQKTKKLDHIHLQVRRHEILGLAGVGGNGQRSLYNAIIGVSPLDEGRILLCGENLVKKSVAERMMARLAGIPEDRIKQGLLMDFSVKESLLLGRHNRRPFSRFGWMSKKKIRAFAEQAIADYEIAVQNCDVRTGTLSGGNLQKVILARELSHNPCCVVASQPTRGLDVGAIEYVHRRLLDLRREGAGILLISEDLDELFNLSDRIAVIYKGRIMGEFERSEATRERIGLLMAGISE
ncbi:MAG: ABC transporter ATP-binding protein [Kiritimatiellae bacterium]|nr:ABC transporter ATP-binding protein [Kiritimatiellia bacterium]